jgi:hypothetical protein
MWLTASEKVLMSKAGMAVKAVRVTGDRGQHSKDMQERWERCINISPSLSHSSLALQRCLVAFLVSSAGDEDCADPAGGGCEDDGDGEGSWRGGDV